MGGPKSASGDGFDGMQRLRGEPLVSAEALSNNVNCELCYEGREGLNGQHATSDGLLAEINDLQ
jgi:hypothetical protein